MKRHSNPKLDGKKTWQDKQSWKRDQLPNPWTFLAQKKPFGFVQTFRPSSLILGNTFKTTSICHGKQAETFGHTLWLFRPTKFFPNQRNSSVKWSIVYYMSATELTNVLPHNSLVQNKEYKLLNNHCIWRYAYSVFIHWLLPNFHSCIYILSVDRGTLCWEVFHLSRG